MTVPLAFPFRIIFRALGNKLSPASLNEGEGTELIYSLNHLAENHMVQKIPKFIIILIHLDKIREPPNVLKKKVVSTWCNG